MGNKSIEQYYTEMAKTITNPKATRNNAKDFSEYDIKLLRRIANKDKTLLDLGSGTGLLINHLYHDFKQITAVEKYPDFSKFINKSPNIKIITDDLLNLGDLDNIKYDIVSLFGVMNYLDSAESQAIYIKAYGYLKEGGILVVKNQMGIEQDVIINGYSEELKTNYYSEYRQVDKEVALLNKVGFTNIEKIDIYPPEYNRWDNTHFYAFICHKK